MKRNNIVHLFISMISGFVISLCLTADRSIDIVDSRSFLKAMNGNSALILILFLLVSYFSYKIISKTYEKRMLVISLILAFCFSFCETAGYNLDHYSTLFYPSFNFYNLIFNLMIFIGYVFVFYQISIVLFRLVKFLEGCNFSQKKNYKYFSNNTQSFFAVAGMLTVFWSVYYFIFFPGIVTPDSWYQIEQGMGFVPLTDEHPFLHTLIQGSIIKFGTLIFGAVNDAIPLCVFIQMICMAFIVSFSVKYMAYKNIPVIARLIVTIFYALHPVVAAYSITLWKDVWMGSFILLYVIVLNEASTNSKKFFSKHRNLLYLILVILAILFAKGTGIIIIILSMPILFVFASNYRKKLLFALAACFGIFFLTRSIIIPALNITKGHLREPLSVPLQQIARTVKYHGKDLSEEEKNTISEILPYDELPVKYDPKLSDEVKAGLNEEVFSKNISKYIGLWLSLGFKYPDTYLESFLSNSYGYWYPETVYWQVTNYSYYRAVNKFDSHDENKSQYNPPRFEGLTNIICSCINYDFRNVPVISTFLSIALYFWISLFCLMSCIYKRRFNLLPMFMPIVAVFVTCIMSPVHAEMRYAYASLLCVPLLILITLFHSEGHLKKSLKENV